MEKFRYQFERLSLLIRTGIFLCEGEEVEECRPNAAFNPIRDNQTFREKLTALTQEQETPLLYQDVWQVVYIGIRKEGKVLLAGPVGLESLSQAQLPRTLRR